ncbi:hypothetical protein K466DRAFT_507392, partial [Polyporus arcularius HHB13444]
YDGKNAQEGLTFISSAKAYHEVAATAGAGVNLVWMVILNRITGDAASWAGPHIITAATTTPWPDVTAFEDVFKAHFCAVDDKEAATAELVKLCKASHRLGTVKEYTAEFNVVAARTAFSVDDKREHHREQRSQMFLLS